jgi:hypothetical protein
MRQLSTNILQALASDDIRAIIAVKIVTQSQTLRYTDNPYDITILGELYQAGGLLKAVEPPKLSKVVDREAYKITLIDPEFSLRSLIEAGITGSEVSVYGVFFNTTEASIGGVAPDSPFLNSGDIQTAYEGVVDTTTLTVDASEGSVIIVIECASPMASLDRVNSFHTTKESMSQRNNADTAFDEVFEGSKQVQHVWGKS